MNNLPKISIVTPSYNQGQFLEETIKSVVNQNYPNLEYIIIDGGSTDNSLDILKKYENHLAYWVSEKDAGHGDALNKGFSKTTGEIMAWINSDDKYYPWTFQTVADVFSAFPDVNWITGKQSFYDTEGRLMDTRMVYKNIYDYLTGNYGWIQQESVFWRRPLWEKTGGYITEEYKLMVDGELWSRFFQYDDLWHVERVIGGYRKHETNRAKLFYEQVINDMETIISKMRTKLPKDVLDLGDELTKRKKFYKSVEKLKPGLLRRILHKLHRELFCQNTKDLNDKVFYNTIDCTNGVWYKNSKPFDILLS